MIVDYNNNYYIGFLILAIIFYIISKKDVRILLSIIIIIIIGYYIYKYIEQINNKNKNQISCKNKLLNNDIKDRNDINTNNFVLKKFPKKVKFLIKDRKLVELILNIRFVKKFDNAKYTDIINYLDKFMKIYIYILADRYDINESFSTLLDLRYLILEEMYSIFVIIPKDLKYMYGLNPYKEIYKSIDEFNIYSKQLINTIERYAKLEKKLPYIEDSYYRPINKITNKMLP